MLKRALTRADRLFISFSAVLPMRCETHLPQPEAEADGFVLKILAANLERGLRDPTGLVESIIELDVDVLLLSEHSELTVAAFETAGLSERWPHISSDPRAIALNARDAYFGSMVASRFPIRSAALVDLGGRSGQIVELEVGTRIVRTVPVHTQAPYRDSDMAVWRSTIEANAGVSDEDQTPTILGGDWNATCAHSAFRTALKSRHLNDAASVFGHRWYPTWPKGYPLFGLRPPPFLTLDHIVISSDVIVRSLERIDLPGTDHRALRAELELTSPLIGAS